MHLLRDKLPGCLPYVQGYKIELTAEEEANSRPGQNTIEPPALPKDVEKSMIIRQSLFLKLFGRLRNLNKCNNNMPSPMLPPSATDFPINRKLTSIRCADKLFLIFSAPLREVISISTHSFLLGPF